jgi:ammonia channel protein AmtB
MYGTSILSGTKLVLIAQLICTVCFFKLYLLQLLQQLFLVLLLRTKFTTYLIFSLLMTLLIYPISGSWVWNAGGWLAKMGFTDFAGSSVVHSVGGWASLVAAALVGPRIGIILTGR